MAIAFVNRAENTVTSSNAASASTAAASHSAANLLEVSVNFQSSNLANVNIGSVTDTAGNTYAQAGTEQTQGINRLRKYYAYNCLGHATNQVTVALNGIVGVCQYLAISVRQFSGIETASDPYVNDAKASGSGTSISSGTVSIGGVAEAVIVAFMEADGANYAAGTGYTLNQFAGGDGQYFADEYHIVTGDEAATATCGNGAWGIKAASFKAAAVAGGQPTMKRWGGTPFVGGQGIGQSSGGGKMWGRSRTGLYVPRRLAA